MNFVEELQQAETKKTVEYATEFATDIKPKLIESAEEGYNGYNIQLKDRDDSHILQKDLFLKTLEKQLDGCTVKLDQAEYTDLLFKTKYYRKFINISWKTAKEE